MENTSNDVPIRDAASLVLLRFAPNGTQVLMGQRGSKAAFMASKFVFPGGAVDKEDLAIGQLAPIRNARLQLAYETTPELVDALPIAGIRELWEETGLRVGCGAAPQVAPAGWDDFFADGTTPDPDALHYFFRAITPPGRPRRFDARFFVTSAEAVVDNVEDFSRASGELSKLQWIDLDAARKLPLPFVTELVLAEVAEMGHAFDKPRPVPFFKHGASGGAFTSIMPESP